MSKKSKNKKSKTKKPQAHQVAILSASEVSEYIRLKFEMENEEFWKWFFSESKWGETNLLSVSDNDSEDFEGQWFDYYKIIKEEFGPDANEDSYLEIEYDLWHNKSN